MNARWMTRPAIAQARHISLGAARRPVDATGCPTVLRTDGTVHRI